MNTAEEFLSNVLSIEKSNLDRALDALYDYIDERLRFGKFSEVDPLLRLAGKMSNDLSIDIMLGLLISTLPAKTKIDYRGSFAVIVATEIIKRKTEPLEILRGLI